MAMSADLRLTAFHYFVTPSDYGVVSRNKFFASYIIRLKRVFVALKHLHDGNGIIFDFLIPNQLDVWLDTATKWIWQILNDASIQMIDANHQGWLKMGQQLLDTRNSLMNSTISQITSFATET